jgi:hypothetical protein
VPRPGLSTAPPRDSVSSARARRLPAADARAGQVYSAGLWQLSGDPLGDDLIEVGAQWLKYFQWLQLAQWIQPAPPRFDPARLPAGGPARLTRPPPQSLGRAAPESLKPRILAARHAARRGVAPPGGGDLWFEAELRRLDRLANSSSGTSVSNGSNGSAWDERAELARLRNPPREAARALLRRVRAGEPGAAEELAALDAWLAEFSAAHNTSGEVLAAAGAWRDLFLGRVNASDPSAIGTAAPPYALVSPAHPRALRLCARRRARAA